MALLAKLPKGKLQDSFERLGHLFPTKSYSIYLTVFFASIVGLCIAYVFSVTTFSLSSVYQAIQLLCILFVLFSLTKLIKFNHDFAYYRMVGFLYILWQVIILVRGDYSDMDYMGVKQLIFDLNYGGLNFLIPLVLFFDSNLFTIRRIFDAVIVLTLTYLLCVVLNIPVLFNGDLTNVISLGTAENYFKYLALPVGLLAFNFRLLDKRTQILTCLVLLTIAVVGIFRARRGMLFIVGSISIYATISYYISSSRKIYLVSFTLYGLFSLILIAMLTKGKEIEEISFFENISERGLEDTRSNVEDCFRRDMSTYDWVFGKGYNGGYKCPGIDDSIFKDGIRKVIETDYLQLIMNGGILNVVLIFLIMLPAVILGLFYSNNNLITSLSIWILLWLVYLYPANVYSFSYYHVTVWLAAVACYNKSLRSIPDSLIKMYFKGKLSLKSN